MLFVMNIYLHCMYEILPALTKYHKLYSIFLVYNVIFLWYMCMIHFFLSLNEIRDAFRWCNVVYWKMTSKQMNENLIEKCFASVIVDVFYENNWLDFRMEVFSWRKFLYFDGFLCLGRRNVWKRIQMQLLCLNFTIVFFYWWKFLLIFCLEYKGIRVKNSCSVFLNFLLLEIMPRNFLNINPAYFLYHVWLHLLLI